MMVLNLPFFRLVHIIIFLLIILCSGCAKKPVGTVMTATAYCGCSQCCSWERGSWKFFKLDFWNRYVSKGAAAGNKYTGLTASGTVPREPQEGLFSLDSLKRPWMIPIRTIFFPWLLLPEEGTIAADTHYYPFGTEMYVPGYGWGIVEDRGGAIKGPNRIDLYFHSHSEALEWGKRKVRVRIYKQ